MGIYPVLPVNAPPMGSTRICSGGSLALKAGSGSVHSQLYTGLASEAMTGDANWCEWARSHTRSRYQPCLANKDVFVNPLSYLFAAVQ